MHEEFTVLISVYEMTIYRHNCRKVHILSLFRCIRLRSEGMGVPLYTDEDHNHFVDLYFVLLYKFQRKAFLDEVSTAEFSFIKL